MPDPAVHAATKAPAPAAPSLPHLSDSESRLRLYESILASTEDFVYLFDLQGRFLYANRELLTVWGRELPDVIGKTCFELGYPDWHAAMHQREIEEVITTKHAIYGEVPFTSQTGHFGIYEYIFTPIFSEDGEVLVVAGTTRDVTARKRAEDALRESENRFRFLHDLGEVTRELRDADSILDAVAQRLCVALKASRCAYAEIDVDADRAVIKREYSVGCASSLGDYALSSFGEAASENERADGSLHQGSMLVIHDSETLGESGGAPGFRAAGIRAIVCCPLVLDGRLVATMAVHQVTPRQWTDAEVAFVQATVERSWAYLARARAERALSENEARFRNLANAMPQIVWTARPDGTLDFTSLQWYDFIGRTEIEIPPEDWHKFVHPEDLPAAYDVWGHSVSTGEAYNTQFRIRRADNEYRWFLVRALPIHTADGAISHWYGTCTDIHEQRGLLEQNARLLESERAARAEAERAGRMKDEFLATLSHELRTPLNAILGWAQVLSDGAPSASDLLTGLSTIERNARAQNQIIEDLLDMSRIISGKVRLDVQRMDLSSVVSAAVETVRPAAEAKGIRLQVVLDSHAQPVSGDANRLQQVFWNLLSNAIKFTPRDGRVQVLVERVNSHLEVSVIDSGQGIEAEFLPHVFDRFRQADASTTRHHGGLGLGLAIVKQLVELHGGSVRAKSGGTSRGSTFIVHLPLTVLHPETEDAGGERRHPRASVEAVALPGGKPDLLGIHALVVDDEADARNLIKRLLEDCEATVRIAGSAKEALAELEEEWPDVLISDIGMPGEDGYALIKQARALAGKGGRRLPALALTAYARSEDRMKAILAGFNLHIAKPVETAELLTMVASLVERT